MNNNEIKDNEKPVLKPENIISLMLKYLPEIKEDDNFSLFVTIGPNYDNLGSETNSYLRDMYDNQESFDKHIDSLKSAVIEQVPVNYTNENNIDYVLRMLDEIPEDLKIYYLVYYRSSSSETFYFNEEYPKHESIPETVETDMIDSVMAEIKQKYRPMDLC